MSSNLHFPRAYAKKIGGAKEIEQYLVQHVKEIKNNSNENKQTNKPKSPRPNEVGNISCTFFMRVRKHQLQ